MKCSTLTAAILAIGSLLVGEVRVSAQYQPSGPYTQPYVSPYLNLLRGGATPGQNFYTLTRPQLGFYSGIGNLQQQTQLNQQLITGLGAANTTALITGQPFGFQTHVSYFQNQLRGGGVGGGAGGGGAGGQAGLATGGGASFGLGGATGGGGARGGGAQGRHESLVTGGPSDSRERKRGRCEVLAPALFPLWVYAPPVIGVTFLVNRS